MIMLVGTHKYKEIHLQFFGTFILTFNFVNLGVLISAVWLLSLFCEIQ